MKDFPTRNKLLKCGLRLHHNPGMLPTTCLILCDHLVVNKYNAKVINAQDKDGDFFSILRTFSPHKYIWLGMILPLTKPKIAY